MGIPESYRQEVLDFIEFLARKAKERQEPEQPEQAFAERDPLQAFIGAVEHGTLAKGIDEELYG